MEQQVFFWERKEGLLTLPSGFKMKIAICDGDRNFLSHLKKILYQYAETRRLDIVADCFLSGEKLLREKTYYNIVFLGYHLCGINGLETARLLREERIDSSIVFISDYTDFVFDAFKVNTFRFLKKSANEGEIYSVLNDYFGKMGEDYPMWIKCGEDIVCIGSEDIYYLEANNKSCLIHLKNETLKCNRTMAKVFALLPQNNFSKTNRAFVVNLSYISRYNSEVIILKNGESIHPSRNYYHSFKEDYRRFSNPVEP